MCAIRVGVIDSGIRSGTQIVAGRSFTADPADMEDRLGHGTAVTDVILQSPLDVELVVARVFDDQLSCGSATCAAAINWVAGYNPIVMNLSFGLRRDDAAVKAACAAASQSGIGLVAASPAQGGPVFPAAYEGVIRATGDARCAPGEIAALSSQQADFGGWVGDPSLGPAGASIGCAGVTARLLQVASNHPGLKFEALIVRLAGDAEYHGVEKR